jgi:hypothetical protein
MAGAREYDDFYGSDDAYGDNKGGIGINTDDSSGENLGQWGDGRTLNKVSRKLANDGYRIGKDEENTRQMQNGFYVGYSDGQTVGKVCGKLYAILRYELQSPDASRISELSSLPEIEKLIFEDIPSKAVNTKQNDSETLSMQANTILQLLRLAQNISSSPAVVSAIADINEFVQGRTLC